MSAVHSLRRVVTGLDADGKSTVIIDGAIAPISEMGGMVWRTDTVPADNSGSDDLAGGPFDREMMEGGGSTFMVIAFEPGIAEYWHATQTIDYIVVLEGEIVLQLEAGEARLKTGDFVVDRGVIHNWRNDGAVRAVIACITLPAHPLKGAE